jgi:hypothetical protein
MNARALKQVKLVTDARSISYAFGRTQGNYVFALFSSLVSAPDFAGNGSNDLHEAAG